MWYCGWLFILCMFIGLFSGMMTNRTHRTFNAFWANMTAIFIFGTLMVWITIGGLYMIGKDIVYNQEKIQTDTITIKSASLNSELHGQFVLGCGSINEEDVYKFYEIIDSTSFKMQSVPTANTRIQEVDYDSTFVPHIISYYYTEYTRKNSWLYFALLNRKEVEIYTNQKILKEHVIYVPKGTIVGDLKDLNL